MAGPSVLCPLLLGRTLTRSPGLGATYMFLPSFKAAGPGPCRPPDPPPCQAALSPSRPLLCHRRYGCSDRAHKVRSSVGKGWSLLFPACPLPLREAGGCWGGGES